MKRFIFSLFFVLAMCSFTRLVAAEGPIPVTRMVVHGTCLKDLEYLDEVSYKSSQHAREGGYVERCFHGLVEIENKKYEFITFNKYHLNYDTLLWREKNGPKMEKVDHFFNEKKGDTPILSFKTKINDLDLLATITILSNRDATLTVHKNDDASKEHFKDTALSAIEKTFGMYEQRLLEGDDHIIGSEQLDRAHVTAIWVETAELLKKIDENAYQEKILSLKFNLEQIESYRKYTGEDTDSLRKREKLWQDMLDLLDLPRQR